MGAVYEAEHEAIGRHAAIKVLHARYAHDAELVARFFNEAKATNRVDHPGLVQVYDFGCLPDGTAYLVMELLRGETLGSRLRRMGTLPARDVARLGQQAADALATAHDGAAGPIVHRDLKPDNLMLVPDAVAPGGERVKILDFGIAKLSGEQLASGPTLSQVVMGTPRYMAPEQCRSASAAQAPADVYALGIILYEALAGRPPFEASEPGELLAMQLRDPPPNLRTLAPFVPSAMEELIMSMLRKDPGGRPTIRQVASSLQAGFSFSAETLAAPTIPPIAAEAVFPSSPSSRSTLSQGAGESLRSPIAQAASPARRGIAVVLVGGLGMALLAGLAIVLKRSSAPSPSIPAASMPQHVAPALGNASLPAATKPAAALPTPVPPAPSPSPSSQPTAVSGYGGPPHTAAPIAEPDKKPNRSPAPSHPPALSVDKKDSKAAKRSPGARDEIPLPHGLSSKPASRSQDDAPIPLPKRLSPRP
jgi:serine/threonine-protein kinase